MTKIAVFVTYIIAIVISCAFAYKKECAVGPQYWCQSFQNAQDCGALRHCTDTVWRYDEMRNNVELSTACEWCQKILENTHKGIQRLANNEELIQSTLVDGCKLLPVTDISSKCTSVMTSYGSVVLSLMKHKRYNTLCNLMDVCSAETVTVENPTAKSPVDNESRMLCHVIVRATYELHQSQHKPRSEIESFLDNDCDKLSNPQLIKKCKDLVHQHGTEIYAHVASNVDLSKVCDYVEDFVDHSIQPISSSVYCDVCRFVMSNAEYMLDAKFTEDKVLSYIDEQVCSRLADAAKKTCRALLLNNGKSVIDGIQSGTKTMLLCTRFQLCHDQVLDGNSSLTKNEVRSFFKSNVCEQLGAYSDACQALLENDGTNVLQTLVNNINGNELCYMFGLCPKQSPLLVEWNLRDDPSKCTRCVKDFTRRKHIAERLVNHSSEFLHHLCGQLPNESDCVKAIDDSFAELLTFIRSMDPRDICIQLKMCDEKSIESVAVVELDNVVREEIFSYLKNDICPKFGSLSAWCNQIVDSEGVTLLDQTSKTIDPHRVCQILDICPSNLIMRQCQDKCQCCKNKVDAYQLKIIKFLKSMVASTRTMCSYMPARETCLQLADIFDSNINNAISRFDSERVCQVLTLCPISQALADKNDCHICKEEWSFRQSRFQTAFDEMIKTLQLLPTGAKLDPLIESTKNQTLTVLHTLDPQTLCKQLGYCTTSPSFEPSPIQLRLRTLVKHQTKTLDERLAYHSVCLKFGSMAPMCEHLMASPHGRRYAFIYRAILQKNPKLFDDDLREQLATPVNTDVCSACKNTVQSTKDFWANALDTIRDLLFQSCEQCPVKDQCHDLYNKLYEAVKSYLNTIDANQLCQSFHLCSSRTFIEVHLHGAECTTCIQRLDQRKEVLRQGIDRVTNYFGDLCQRFQLKPCQVFLQKLKQSADSTIQSWNTQEICTKIGFCANTDIQERSSSITFDQYETYVKVELEKTICSQLGPFQSWCRQILQGNREQIQTVKINDNLRDLMHIGQSNNENLLSAVNQDRCNKDQCQCCIDRVNGKKDCLKNMAQQVFGVLVKSCDYCPAKDQCRQYWTDNEKQCIASINDIDAKQICVQLGFCNASSLCMKMGHFQEACEQVLAKYIETLKEEPKLIEEHLPKTSVTVLHAEENRKPADDSNTTCILCEYTMKILSNYIHSQSTEVEIQKSLDEVCQRMPKTLEKQCTEFVDNYGAAIVSTLVQQSDLSKLCQKLNICTKEMSVNVEHLTKANVASCGVCDYVSTYVHFALKRDPSDESLRRALSSACTHLSVEQSSQCQTLVQLFGPQVRHLQLSLGNNFCQHLTICQTPMSDLKPALPIDVDSSSEEQAANDHSDVQLKDLVTNNVDEAPQCLLCHYVVSYLDSYLKNNKSEAAVEAALAKVCTVLPKKERPECTQFVTSYGALLAQLILELADPGLVCRYMGLCQVVLPNESSKITYSNHQYARIPI